VPWRDNFMTKTYKDLCEKIINEYKKIKNPSIKDLSMLSKKFNIDISVIRECIGLKDTYEFEIDKD
tara:strand:- start:300 stop:497 length:198 start_codon:yes stop_codon:yes gene_type:complete